MQFWNGGKKARFISDWNLKSPYLLTYNVAMFLGYALILIEMIHGYSTSGAGERERFHERSSTENFLVSDYFQKTWTTVAPKLMCCQVAQYFEVFHSLLKMTRTSWKASLLQVFSLGAVSIFLTLFLVNPRPPPPPVMLRNAGPRLPPLYSSAT